MSSTSTDERAPVRSSSTGAKPIARAHRDSGDLLPDSSTITALRRPSSRTRTMAASAPERRPTRRCRRRSAAGRALARRPWPRRRPRRRQDVGGAHPLGEVGGAQLESGAAAARWPGAARHGTRCHRGCDPASPPLPPRRARAPRPPTRPRPGPRAGRRTSPTGPRGRARAPRTAAARHTRARRGAAAPSRARPRRSGGRAARPRRRAPGPEGADVRGQHREAVALPEQDVLGGGAAVGQGEDVVAGEQRRQPVGGDVAAVDLDPARSRGSWASALTVAPASPPSPRPRSG